MMELPDGYERHDSKDLHYLVREGEHEAVRVMGLSHLATVRKMLVEGRPSGRGRVFDVMPRKKQSFQPLVLKQVLHGGLYGRMNRERHTGPGRLLAELSVTEKARDRGVPAPEIAYLSWTRQRFPSLFLATFRVPGSRDLERALTAEPTGRERNLTLAAAARAVREMHDAGLVHADLNLGNVMVTEFAGDPEGFVLDLDGSWFPAELTETHRAWNLARLLRSLEKSDIAGRVNLRERVGFLREYCGGTGSRYRELKALIARRSRLFFIHRFGWRLGLTK
jgi:3-deoxy-D-manno-octulosonic acid kinase